MMWCTARRLRGTILERLEGVDAILGGRKPGTEGRGAVDGFRIRMVAVPVNVGAL
jgi:hypothetical protein